MAGTVRIFSPAKETEVIQAYKLTPNVPVVAKQFGVNPWNVKQCLKRHGVEINRNPKRSYRYEVNHAFLDDPSSFDERHAYFLGWMHSDGHIQVKQKYLKLSIAESDGEVLEVMKRMLDYAGPIGFQYRKPSSVMGQTVKKHQNRVHLQVGSEKLVNRLESFGMDTRKSTDTGFPIYIKPIYWNHFVLGLFEGDGTFSFCESTKKCEANLVVNPTMSKDIEKIMMEQMGIKVHFAQTTFSNGAVILRFCGNNQLLKFFTWLYRNNRFRLARKSAVFDRLIEHKKTLRLKLFERPIMDEAVAVNSALHVS